MKSTCYFMALALTCLMMSSAFSQSKSSAQGRNLTTSVFPQKPTGKISAILQLIHYEFTGGQPTEENVRLNRKLFLINADKVRIEASALKDGNALAAELKGMGATEISVFKRIVNAWIPIKNIPDLDELSSLRFAEVVYIPPAEIGSVDSEADSAMAVAAARRKFCVDGTGINIGVLSDSYNWFGGAPSGVSSGDLPGVGNPNGYTTPVTVVRDAPNSIDEGRAMSELIHDLAPGAALFFNSALYGQASYANDILALATTHQCDVIVDDIRYLEEPFYMDGLVAQACDKVNGMGVPYFASAGNYAQSSYEAPFNSFTGSTGNVWHDFDPGPGVDTMQSITVNGGSIINITLQWDDPWGTITPNSPATDIDFGIFNAAGTGLIASSTRDNFLSGEPTEFFGITAPPGGPVTYNITILKFAGPAPAVLKWVIRNASGLVINEYTTPTTNGQATGYGHSNAAGANAVGACAWFSSPAFGVSPPIPEPFTSSGGVQIRFDTTGTAISPITRNKPEFTANDGISNTFFSGGSFFGTSAAAPDAAAVAALMLEADPTLTPAQVRNLLSNSAIDMSSPGFDFLTGAGLIQADSALAQVYDSLCNISGISVQTPPTLDIGNLTYSVGLRVSFSGAICTDSLLVNGENFDLTGDTFQDVMLTGLPANGLPVDVTAAFDKSVACTLTVTGLFNALLSAPALTDTLVITEIMYDSPESGADSLEFIEIYNPTASPTSMAGYSFTEGITYTFGNVVIAAGGYVVVCEDSVALFNQFAVSAYEWGGVNALSNGGEDIVLKDNNGNTIDSVDYDEATPWPTGASGNGPSIVLCDWTADNNLGASWTESTSGTGIFIGGNELKGSPGASDQACLPCTPDAVSITQFTCDSNQVDTTVVTLTNAGGCDSVLTTFIVFDPGSLTTLPDVAICDGDSALIFGQYQSVPGPYFNVLQNVNGCDSILATQLLVNPTFKIVMSPMNICEGDSMLIFGVYRNTAGTYYDTLQTVDGCDSVVCKALVVDSVITTFDTLSICDGDSALIFGNYETVAGNYSNTSTSAAGCDSIHTITLQVQPFFSVALPSMSICQGDSMLIFGIWRDTAGVYYDTLQTIGGCDSILTKQLMVNPTYKVVLPTMNICQGDSMLIFGIYQSAAATYYDTLLTGMGCDSIICKTLIVDSVILTTETRTICEGDSSLLFGNYESMAGVYIDTSQSAGGCDSIHTITLNVLPAATGATTAAICDGDSILLGGAFQTSGGAYVDTLVAANGCDSVVTTTLVVWPIHTVTVNDSICPGDSLLIAGSYQTAAGSYATMLAGSNGCDSVVTTILSIRDSLSCPFDTGSSALVCVSDSSWRLSTVVTTATANSYPWPGVPGVPASPTFTLPVDVGQPYPWVHLLTVDSAEVITSESGVTYYLKTFELVDPVGIAARFRMFVDDDMQIFVNGHPVALEKDMGAVNYRTVNHDLQFNGDGTYTNGNLGGDPFDAVTSADMDTVFKTGTNELVLAIRNRTSKADIGGFSFRMDLDKGALAAKSAPAEVSATAYGIMIYPNPAENYLTVTLENVRDKQPCGITITDLSGKLLRHTEITGKQTKEALRLDISDYATGLYMIRITAGDKSFTGRFVKK